MWQRDVASGGRGGTDSETFFKRHLLVDKYGHGDEIVGRASSNLDVHAATLSQPHASLDANLRP